MIPRLTVVQYILLFAVMTLTPSEIEDGKEEGKTFVCWSFGGVLEDYVTGIIISN